MIFGYPVQLSEKQSSTTGVPFCGMGYDRTTSELCLAEERLSQKKQAGGFKFNMC